MIEPRPWPPAPRRGKPYAEYTLPELLTELRTEREIVLAYQTVLLRHVGAPREVDAHWRVGEITRELEAFYDELEGK